jgi:5,10-methylene-tetrahydrofolate dehydrogenase/methenyl tetrahydrofolate cyclohydrolase
MIPGLGDKIKVEIETIEKTRAEYSSQSYLETKLPVAPAIMIDDDIIDTPNNITQAQLEKLIDNRLKKNA